MLKTSRALLLTTLACTAIFAFALIPAISQATPINYGDFDGTTVMYLDVTEDSVTDNTPLFGAPTISGDALDFNPIGFGAFASGAGGNDMTDGQLFFMIQAKQGQGINTVLLSEAGDTGLAGFGTDATYTEVKGLVTVDILATNVGPVSINHQASMSFSPSGGTYGLGTDGGGGPSYSTNWTGGVLLDIGAILVQNGITGQTATKVNINLDNKLLALSQEGTSATIAKKDFDSSAVTIKVNDIPEPTTALLAMIGMLALTCRRQA
ncbi:hypothetical protein [Bythopirellula polymerisocia]|uniref:PEP-CTERM protein-sorting domain-containing protein n=1 Tax=Bythopirellula polymerisocia TaxID=2528003 RepID=A0A5C6CN34_9BACT|nr:hypothetical protein [Bythopirellula polymerisocia]TWU25812.1 hypothetical protein Pla144_30240 [Bythopirellula polymerisocia]